jgi:hypothetical protein
LGLLDEHAYNYRSLPRSGYIDYAGDPVLALEPNFPKRALKVFDVRTVYTL